MSRQRIRFSVRTLLVCVAAVAVLLAAGIRFGPHAVWLATSSQLPSLGPIPTGPLVVKPVAEKFGRCEIGPLAIDLPMSMRENFVVERDPLKGSASLRFTDNKRTAIVNLTPMKDFVMFPLAGFPDKANQTDAQLYRQIAGVESSDFSLGMTADELRWHKWLITNRRLLPSAESIEHVDSPDVEGNLLRFSSPNGIAYNFEWATTDGEWKGAVTFHDQADNPDWIRYAASTFTLTGDPITFQNATDAKIKKLIAEQPPAIRQLDN